MRCFSSIFFPIVIRCFCGFGLRRRSTMNANETNARATAAALGDGTRGLHQAGCPQGRPSFLCLFASSCSLQACQCNMIFYRIFPHLTHRSPTYSVACTYRAATAQAQHWSGDYVKKHVHQRDDKYYYNKQQQKIKNTRKYTTMRNIHDFKNCATQCIINKLISKQINKTIII